MDIMTLKSQIMKNTLSNFYIFTGIELGIQKIYLEQMSKVLNLPIVRADSVLDIYKNCTTKSLFGETHNMYVIRDDKEFPKNEKFYKEVPDNIGNNVIILLYEKLDKRLAFGKYFKDSTVVFEKLAPNVLESYIKKSCKLSNENASRLSNEIFGSYDLAMNEVDKVNQYAQSMKVSEDESLEALFEQGVIYQPEESNVFNFSDAVCSRDARESIRIAKILADNNVSAINILGTLYNSFKTIMLIQSYSGKNVCEVTGLDNRQVYFNKKYVGIYNMQELVEGVKLIAKVIDDIKSGRIEEKYATSYIIVNIL